MKFTKLLYGMLIAAAILATSACSSDDDGGTNLEVPAYEAVSAKYIVNDSRAAINSLELTASGNYIVVKNQYNYSVPEKRTLAQNVLMCNQLVTRAASYGNIIYGKFTQIAENEYDLEGYGVVTVTAVSGEVYNLDITLDNGNVINVGARKQQTYEISEASDNLCRTWNISKIGFKVEVAGRTYDKMVNEDELDVLFTDYIKWVMRLAGYNNSDIPEGYLEEAVAEYVNQYNESKPLSVIFTKSGSYMVHYNNEMIGVSTWIWENESKGILRYSWNHDNIYDSAISGTCKISYSGNMLLLGETVEQDGVKVTITYGMIE